MVCLRYLVFRRILERYTHVFMGIPEMCTLRYAHYRALLPPGQICTSAKNSLPMRIFCWRYSDGKFEEGRADEAQYRQRSRRRRFNASSRGMPVLGQNEKIALLKLK